MNDVTSQLSLGRVLTWLALTLSLGGVAAALIAALGSANGLWEFGTGLSILRYALYAAMAGGVLAIIAFIVSRRGDPGSWRLNALAFLVAALFTGYLGNQIATARRVPPIHDVTTNVDDLPQFKRLTVRADNLAKIPRTNHQPELAALAPVDRWKVLHRKAYADLQSLHIALSPAEAVRRAEALAKNRGWAIADVDMRAGTVEATATSFFFRFKDDVVVRVRPDASHSGGSIVDMRSISRVGGSDVGVNAARIRSFFSELAQT